ncbi:type III secretory pathway component EscU [Acidovorax soli]|uniref:Type III secretory pathway component EscU n=1 Tax=Acidovorax soli TaxID=592050 RepID=A0A7X0PM26_9BURK|nr:hypothetical protein [Acidovorax soli]MBB6564112.1 type III secretory pathway component EscU [Acidovorax soli]
MKTSATNQSNIKRSRHYLFVFLIFILLPFFLHLTNWSSAYFLNSVECWIPSARKMGQLAVDKNEVQLILSIALLFSFLLAAWQFFFVADRLNHFLLDFEAEGSNASCKLLFKSILGFILLSAVLWYLYALPGGIDLSKNTRAITIIGLALNYKLLFGFFVGFISVGVSAVWFALFLYVYYFLKITFNRI